MRLWPFFLLIVVVSQGKLANAQKLVDEFSVSLGTGNYLGDIGGVDEESHGFLFDLSPQSTRFSLAGTYGMALRRDVWLDGQLSIVNLYGDDAFTTSGPRRARNLHFRNTLIESVCRVRWQVWDGPDFQAHARQSSSFYLFAGVGVFYHNPQTRLRTETENSAAWYDLRELKTEGQQTPYSIVSMCVPMGFGMNWNMGSGWKVGWEASWRWTSTDYIDDVSSTYGNPEGMSELAVQLSSQVDVYAITEANAEWDESQMVHFQYNESGNTPRGNPEKNDGFGTLQVKMTKALSNRRLSQGKRWAGHSRRQSLRSRRKFKLRNRY